MSRPEDAVAYLRAMHPEWDDGAIDIQQSWGVWSYLRWPRDGGIEQGYLHPSAVDRWLDWTAGTWAGPLADECSGAPAGGDNDGNDGGSHACPWPSDCPARCRHRDCDGADDNPRDCLEA